VGIVYSTATGVRGWALYASSAAGGVQVAPVVRVGHQVPVMTEYEKLYTFTKGLQYKVQITSQCR
jgi:hypothetical protein